MRRKWHTVRDKTSFVIDEVFLFPALLSSIYFFRSEDLRKSFFGFRSKSIFPSYYNVKLSDKYSQARLENACKLALSRLSNPTYKNIKLILESGQDDVKQEHESTTNKEDTTYAFTSGTEYYGG